jgi:dTDP-4-amino-4,6-dideoxygalactose transaminase
VLLSGKVNYWTGEEGHDFEKEFAASCETAHAVAMDNGTVALDAALKALGIGRGDEVVVTPRTFLATVSSIVNAGATPIFADVDKNSQNITPETVEAVLTERTRAVLCVHLAGWPCEMDGMRALCQDRELCLIEDCAQAHGARYKGQPVGGLGDVAAWSFCQDKILTTGGEGGMVTTNNRELWKSMWAYKDHGKSWEAVYERSHPPGFRWLHEKFGTNGRLTEMQSAIGRIQLQRLPEWHKARTQNANTILEVARQCSALRVPEVPSHVEHGWYKCYIFVRPEVLADGWTRDAIMSEITSRSVPCYSGSCSEVYLEKAFDGTPFRPGKRLPNARELGETSLMFLVHPTLNQGEIEKACDVLKQVCRQAIR